MKQRSRSLTLSTLLASAFVCSATQAQASTIIRPGQCIIVGTTEVCASMPTKEQCDMMNGQGQQQTSTIPQPEILFTCRYAMHPNPEVPNLKTYALVKTTVQPDGRKSELIVKNYGIDGKAACDTAADEKNAREEAKK